MAEKVRILFVLVNHAGEYLTVKRYKFSSDFSKARIYKRKCDATNSSYGLTCTVAQRKIVLIDPN